jgi:hypothetical protein
MTDTAPSATGTEGPSGTFPVKVTAVTPESLEKRLEDFGTKIVSDVVSEVKALLAKAPAVVADVTKDVTAVTTEAAKVAAEVPVVDARVTDLLGRLHLGADANTIATVGAWIAEHFA